MCRGCVFVIVDEESGDVDGCLKEKILNEVIEEAYTRMHSLRVGVPLEFFDKFKDLYPEEDEKCFTAMPNWHVEGPEDSKKWAEAFWCAREKAVDEYKRCMEKIVEKRLISRTNVSEDTKAPRKPIPSDFDRQLTKFLSQ